MGAALHEHMADYYEFRQMASRVEEALMLKIGTLAGAQFRAAWSIHFRYAMMRFGKISKQDIIAGGYFLNYGITWDEAERVFVALSEDASISSSLSSLSDAHDRLIARVKRLTKDVSALDNIR